MSKGKYLSFITILLIIVMIFFSFKYFQSTRTIKIGYSGSLSGLNSDLGISGRNGATLAAKHINEKGGIDGKDLLIIAKDDLNDPQQALAVDKEFEHEGIEMIIGHMTSQMAESSIPYINDNNMLMISPTIAIDSLSEQDDYFFRVIPSNKTQARAICDLMIADGIHNASVIIDESNILFSGTLRDYFIEYFQAAGGNVVCSSEFKGVNILNEECIELITSAKVDGVFIIAASESLAIFSQKLYQLDLKTNIYGPTWAMTVDLIEHGGASIEGANFVNYFNNDSQSIEYLQFSDDYKDMYGENPSFASYLSYESVNVLASAIFDSGSIEPTILANYIKTQKRFKGLDGPIIFNDFGDIDRPIYIYKIINGKYVVED